MSTGTFSGTAENIGYGFIASHMFFSYWASPRQKRVYFNNCLEIIQNDLGLCYKESPIHWKDEQLKLYGYSVPLVHVSAFTPVPYCFDYESFVIQFEMSKCCDGYYQKGRR